MINYQTRTIEFKGLTVAGIGDFKISLGEFSTEKKNIDSIAVTASAIDDYQYQLCDTLSNPTMTKRLTEEDLRKSTLDMMTAQACVLYIRLAFEAFRLDPKGQSERLDASFKKIDTFVQSIVTQAVQLNTETERNNLISNTLSSIGVDEKELNKAAIGFISSAKTKLWSVDNRENQIREANRKMETKLMQIVRQRNLNAQLPRDRRPSISELVDILLTNELIPIGGEERSRKSAATITSIGDRVDRGEQISQEAFTGGDYTLAIAWFEQILDDIT
jgi:hypothetical protein